MAESLGGDGLVYLSHGNWVAGVEGKPHSVPLAPIYPPAGRGGP